MSEYCSVLSSELGEPIAGSAVAQTMVWIVLEHNRPWGAKAVLESELPAAVKDRLLRWERELEGARIQLARRGGDSQGPIRLWLGHTGLGGARLVEWSLPEVEALLDLDVPALAAALARGERIPGAVEREQPLVLVCTNGRRDRCCAKFGVAVARALADQGLDVWQTTHLGGHRFAPTLLQLPAGLCYGRVQPSEAPALAKAIQAGEVYRLDRLRGRVALAEVEQAAESAWRQRTGSMAVDALVAVEQHLRGDTVVVSLRDREGADHSVTLQCRKTGATAPPSCGKPAVTVEGWFVVE